MSRAEAPHAAGHDEREVKIRLADVRSTLERLSAAGAEAVGSVVLEEDVLLDDASRSLRARDAVLRVRRRALADGTTRALLTFKGPARIEDGMRVREEIETSIGEAATAREVFARLGLAPVHVYQKRRRTFRLHGAVLCLDETPLGEFLEIEGSPAQIDAVASRLGHGPDEYVTDSYPSLWRQAHPDGPRDMLFAPEEPA
jgi:adenylate cyclase class 2